MKLLVTISCAILATVSASHVGLVLKGPSGVVTDHGPIGPDGNGPTGHGGWVGGSGAWAGGHDDGQWHGEGQWHGNDGQWDGDNGQWHGDNGQWNGDDGQWHGDGAGAWGHQGAVVVGAPLVGLGHGGWAAGGYGHGAGAVSIGHHGVAVVGPKTVPATIAGPAGKVHADGLWGPTYAHGYSHGHGHW